MLHTTLTDTITNTIPTFTHKPKQPWITNTTWELIEQRNTARQAQNDELEQQLSKQIKKAARTDKTNWLKEQLEHSAQCISAKDKWQWIKRLKQPYTGKSIALKDLNGKLVNTFAQAETFGEYLEQKHWGNPHQHYTGSTLPIHEHSPVNMNPVTLKELRPLIQKMKNNKATGPDNIPAEAFKWLTHPNLEHIITLFNQILSTGTLPTAWSEAVVVEIYKGKGSHTDPEMYRPISLLSTAYKLFARLLQSRLETAIDHKLRHTQFGFRKNRSTSQPIHIVRRLIEQAERKNESLYSLFLDWEKAFDKIHPQALITSLRRFGVQPEFVNLIGNIYATPQFTVRAQGATSTQKVARTGIRQGCPLSPYLFLIVHSAIMHDVQATITPQHHNQLPWLHSYNNPLFDLAYADDTVILCRSAEQTQTILHSIQTTAAQYNLQLNKGKCELLRTNAQQEVYFKDTSTHPPSAKPLSPAKQRTALNKLKVKVKQSAKYLGVYITPKASNSTDISQRIHRGRAGFDKLHKFWRHSNITKAWKIQVFNTVFIPMLTYATESAHLTPTDLAKLDSFQAQCLRKIDNKKSTYFTKVLDPSQTTHTNQDILSYTKQIPISQTILALQLKFLGHVLRGSSTDLETDICFTKTWVYRGGLPGDGLRRGKPKTSWLIDVSSKAWSLLTAQSNPHPQTRQIHSFYLPWCFFKLQLIATDRQFWRTFAKLPTSRPTETLHS